MPILSKGKRFDHTYMVTSLASPTPHDSLVLDLHRKHLASFRSGPRCLPGKVPGQHRFPVRLRQLHHQVTASEHDKLQRRYVNARWLVRHWAGRRRQLHHLRRRFHWLHWRWARVAPARREKQREDHRLAHD